VTNNNTRPPGYGVVWEVKTYTEKSSGGIMSFPRTYVRPDLPNVHPDSDAFLNDRWANYYMNRGTRGPSITTLSGMNYSSGEMTVQLNNVEEELKTTTMNGFPVTRIVQTWTPYPSEDVDPELEDVYYRISIIEYGGESNSSVSIPSSSVSSRSSFSTVRSLPKKLSVKYHPKQGKYLITGLVDSLYTQVPSILIPQDAKFDNSEEAGGNYSKYIGPVNTSFAFQFVIKLDIYLGLDNFKESNPEFGDDITDSDLNQWFDCNVYSQEEYDNFIQRTNEEGNSFDSPLEIIYGSDQGSHVTKTDENESQNSVNSRAGRGNDQRSQIIFIYLAPNDLRDFFITRYGNERLVAEVDAGVSSVDEYDFVVDDDGNIDFKFYYVEGVGYMTGVEYLNYLYSNGFLRKFL
jgi:hypothetical protein